MLEPAFAFADELKHEHVSLLEQLTFLEAGMEPPAVDCAGVLLGRLRDVHANLGRHFDFEEQDGYMNQILSDAPYLYHAAQALLAEHTRIGNELDSMITAVACVPTEGPVTPALRAQLRQWVLLVRDHEARENRLTQKACNDDIGVDD